jgi:hypothetical protein
MLLFGAWVYAHIHPSLLCTVLTGVSFVSLVVAFLMSVVAGPLRWRRLSRWYMLPSLLCLIFLATPWFSAPIGVFIADWLFRKNLNEYARVVEDVRSGTIPCNPRFERLDVREMPGQIVAIRAARYSRDEMIVEFLIGSDVPLLHTGYVFKGYDEANSIVPKGLRPETKWPYVRHVLGDWYHFSDQPGL